MKIAFNPSTVAALTTPPNNKDITFDLRGQNIFARGVEFKGTDTNTWRDIKINNVSIGSHTLDLRNGSNTTLTNTNGVVTINSTWRPVVDNLTSDSTTSSLSANQGRILAGLINGKSDSDHNHDDRYVKKSGDTMSGVLTIDTTNFGALTIKRNDDANGASIQFRGKSSVYGYIGLNNSTKDKQFLRWSSDTSRMYTILDTSSTYISNGKGVINGTTITQIDNATNSTNSTNARKLVNWYSARPTSLNAQFGDGSLRIFYATSSTTEGKSPDDAAVLHLAWDNNSGWDSQLAISNPSNRVYSRSQNAGTWQPWKTLAFTTDIPSSLKNPYSFNVFGVVYDGSAAKTVTTSTFVSQLPEGASTVTDGTMFITSWASNSGFADTNAVNVPYKRKAIHLWEYIKAKTDSLYATKEHNHDGRYLRLSGQDTMQGNLYLHSHGISYIGRGLGDKSGADFTEANIVIRSWWGISFKSYDDIVRTYIDTRTGNIGTKGVLNAVGAVIQGRVYNGGDDEGIIINPASNGYAGLTLGTHNGERSVFYLTKGNPFWRYNNGSTNLDIYHPKKSGTIALTSDIPNKDSWNYDDRYYTETEVNSLLDAKLNRQNLSYGTWNPRGYHLAADYHYNGGDLSISENNGKMYVSVDGCFWQNEGQYRVLDTSDIGDIRDSVTLHQYLSATDAAWYPLVWGGASHNNTSDSTGPIYKSYDKLSWQTSSQTLYATHLRTTYIDLENNRGISQVTSGGTSPYKGIRLPDLQSNGIGMFSKIGSGNGADEGGIIISADTSVIYNSFDIGWGLTVRDKDRGQTDISGDGTIAFGVRQDYRAYSLGGFEKAGSDNSYVLLGGGDHKLESSLNVAYSKYLTGIALTGGHSNDEGYRLIFEKTMGGWDINYGVWAIAFRHSGRGTLNIGFDTTNNDGSTYIYDIRFLGSIASIGHTPFRAFYNSTTKVFRIYWYYVDYTSGDIAVLRGNIEPHNGTWMTSLPNDVGTELAITYNMADMADQAVNADTVDGEHASSFVRAGHYEGNDLNKLDTYSFIRSVNSNVSSTSPKGNTGWYNVIQLVHRNGASDGPSYIGQIALGMTTNTNDMFFRGKRTDPWKTVIHSGNYTEFINNYYWANVKISASSSTTTSPTVHTLTATRVCAGHNPGIDNSISCSNWFRSSGNTGWYNTTYQGGWYMSDTSWIRAYNGVGIYTSGQIYSSSSIRMSNILLAHTDEINNSANGGIHLNYRNSGNVSLCYGGGNVGIGTITPSYKLDVNGQMRASGFHHSSVNSDNYILLAGGGYKSFGGDESHPIFLGYLHLYNGNDGTISGSFPCLGYSVPFTYTRGGAYCLINIPNTSFQTFYIKAAIASVHYSGAGMGHWVGNHRGDGAWWLHCDAVGSNAVQVKGFHLANENNDSWWGGNPLYSGDGAAKIITVCLFGYVKFR